MCSQESWLSAEHVHKLHTVASIENTFYREHILHTVASDLHETGIADSQGVPYVFLMCSYCVANKLHTVASDLHETRIPHPQGFFLFFFSYMTQA